MKNQSALLWVRELLWWVITALLVLLLLIPCYGIITDKLLLNNALLAFAALTMFRYTVFLNQVPYLSHLYARVGLLILLGVGFFQFFRVIQDFLFVIDEYSISTFLHPDVMFQGSEVINQTYLYFKQEYLFLCVSLLMLTPILMLRIVASLWKLGGKYNFNRKEEPEVLSGEQN